MASFSKRAPIVLDIEATCWGDDEPRRRAAQPQETEFIEIGAARLDAARLQVIDTFQTFVRPTRHPTLSAFCTQLTTITQADVDAAPTFPGALAALTRWLGEAPVVLCAWGGFERVMFRRHCRAAGAVNPFAGAYLDVKVEFSRWSHGRIPGGGQMSAAAAGASLGVPAEGTLHRGLDDALLVARILRAIRDPARVSERARAIYDLARERAPRPTHRGHARDRFGRAAPEVQRWAPLTAELDRVGLVETLAEGRGVLPRPGPRRAAPTPAGRDQRRK